MAAIKKISPLLAVASGSLLAQNANAQDVYENDWKLDFSYLYYGEEDRVKVNKYVADINGRLSDNDTISMKLVLDSMSGATPTGEVANDTSVTSTGTSGGSASSAGGIGGLAKFDDTRLSADIAWLHNHSRTLQVSYGAYVSVENDYNAIGGTIAFEKFNDNKTFSWTGGISASADEISGTGGDTPQPLALTSTARTFGEGERNSFDLIGGFTKVLNSRTVTQFNIGYSYSEGYLTDPYKLISLTLNDAVGTTSRYESRPGERTRTHMYWKISHHTRKNNTIQFATRYYTDDWDIDSFTIEYKHRLNQFNGNYFEPQLRLYNQTAANFYVRSLEIGTPLPEFASADARLAELSSATLAAKYGIKFSDRKELNMRLGYYYQDIENNNFEDNKAIVFNINYSLEFE